MSERFDPARDLHSAQDGIILACRRATPPSDTEMRKLYNDLAPLDPGWREELCRACRAPIRVGIRQQAARHEYETKRKVFTLCMECAALANELRDTETVVKHLGGS